MLTYTQNRCKVLVLSKCSGTITTRSVWNVDLSQLTLSWRWNISEGHPCQFGLAEGCAWCPCTHEGGRMWVCASVYTSVCTSVCMCWLVLWWAQAVCKSHAQTMSTVSVERQWKCLEERLVVSQHLHVCIPHSHHISLHTTHTCTALAAQTAAVIWLDDKNVPRIKCFTTTASGSRLQTSLQFDVRRTTKVTHSDTANVTVLATLPRRAKPLATRTRISTAALFLHVHEQCITHWLPLDARVAAGIDLALTVSSRFEGVSSKESTPHHRRVFQDNGVLPCCSYTDTQWGTERTHRRTHRGAVEAYEPSSCS